MKKILLIQTASIGDVVLATPVAEKLHAFFPDAKIDILVKNGNQSLFVKHPFLHKVWVFDKSKKYRNLFHLIKNIRKENYDVVINMQRFFTSGLITMLSKGKQTVGFDKNPLSFLFTKKLPHLISASGTMHETERNLTLVSHITNDDLSFPIRLYPTDSDKKKIEIHTKAPFITVSPASLWFTKQYPLEKWVDFVGSLDPELIVCFLGGKNDKALCDEIISRSGHFRSQNLAGQLSFLESAALMKHAKMNYVNDSAPMHFASSVNAPTTAVYCSTVPQFGFGPKSDNAKNVEIRCTLDCRPCGLHGYRECPKGHFKCALLIDTNELLTQLGITN